MGVTSSTITPQSQPAGAEPFAQRHLVWAINHERTQQGLQVLRADPMLYAISEWRDGIMVANGLLSHQMPDGRYVWDELTARRYPYQQVGEILGWESPIDDTTIDRVVRDWMASPEHRPIILGRWDRIGAWLQPDLRRLRTWFCAVFKA